LTSPVRWVEGVRYLAAEGVTAALEIGPRAVVSGLMVRISDAIRTSSITDADTLEAFVGEVER
jgi:[acyl-carrier-protein] S-malonyltransferase